MKNLVPRQGIALVMLMLVAFLVTACDDVERKCAQGSANLASAIGTGITIKRSLLEHGMIDPGEDKAITEGMLQMNQNLQLLNHWLADYHTNRSQSKSTLYVLLQTIGQNNTLLQQTLRVKNTQAQQELSIVTTALNAGMVVLTAVMGGIR